MIAVCGGTHCNKNNGVKLWYEVNKEILRICGLHCVEELNVSPRGLVALMETGEAQHCRDIYCTNQHVCSLYVMLFFLRHSNKNLYLEQAGTLEGCSGKLKMIVSARVSSSAQCSRVAVALRPCSHGVYLAERGSGFMFWDSKRKVAINKRERGWVVVYISSKSAIESIKTVEERSVAVQTRLWCSVLCSVMSASLDTLDIFAL